MDLRERKTEEAELNNEITTSTVAVRRVKRRRRMELESRSGLWLRARLERVEVE